MHALIVISPTGFDRPNERALVRAGLKATADGLGEQVYAKVMVAVLVRYDRDPYTSFAALDSSAQQQPRFQTLRVVPSQGLPQIEVHHAEHARLLGPRAARLRPLSIVAADGGGA